MLRMGWLRAFLGLFRHGVPTATEPLSRSLPELASAALKPGQKTWLVTRAVSLRAF